MSIEVTIGHDEIRSLAKWLTTKLEDDLELISRMYTEAIGPVIVERLKEAVHTICEGCKGLFIFLLLYFFILIKQCFRDLEWQPQQRAYLHPCPCRDCPYSTDGYLRADRLAGRQGVGDYAYQGPHQPQGQQTGSDEVARRPWYNQQAPQHVQGVSAGHTGLARGAPPQPTQQKQ